MPVLVYLVLQLLELFLLGLEDVLNLVLLVLGGLLKPVQLLLRLV